MNATELLNAHFHNIQTDFTAWRGLFADDAIMELPYAPASLGSPLKGIDAIAESVKGFLASLRDMKINVARVYRIEGEDSAFAEFSMTAVVIHTGRTYSQQYVVYVRAKQGKIALYREYLDPTRLAAAFTP